MRFLIVAAFSILFSDMVKSEERKDLASCRIEINTTNNSIYRGLCDMYREPGGTFTLTIKDRKQASKLDGFIDVTVFVYGKNNANVSGLTEEGVKNRWGPARRSDHEPACWIGDDFKVCAWKIN